MITTFYPPHVGGIEQHVENLSTRLSRRGHKITVLTSSLPGNPPSKVRYSNGIEVLRLKTFFPLGRIYPSLASQGFTLNAKKTIKNLIKDKKIDIVHVHGHHYYLSWQAIRATKELQTPSILTLHGLFALNPSDSIAKIEEEIFNYVIFKQELSSVSATIGLTSKITKYAQRYGPPHKKYYTIPNGVNDSPFVENKEKRSIYRKKFQIKNDQIVVLFLGRFASIKGILELAEASKLAVKANNDVFFLFVGGGPLLDELARTISPIKENSAIIGWVPPNKIHELYLAADIFVLPSKSEALPLTILEAMAARLWIVATPVGGIPEVLKPYPFKTSIPESIPSKICESILQSIKNIDSQSDFLHYPKINFVTNYNWEKITDDVENTYWSSLKSAQNASHNS